MRHSASSKVRLQLLALVLILPMFLVSSFAHSGGTDSSGGHRDNKNASGLGYYHYHHGCPPHLHPGGVCPYDAPIRVPRDTIKIDNQPSSMTIGDSFGLRWTVTYYSGNSDVSWSSSDTSVLTAYDGTLTAISPGTATVTAKLYNGSKSFKVKVNPVYANSIKLDIPSNRLEMTHTTTVSGIVLPENATYRDIFWKSSNVAVATIDESGSITAVSPGTTTIIASNKDGVKDSFSLEVFEILPKEISVSEIRLSIPYQSEGSIAATVLPGNATYKTIAWAASNPEVIEINETGEYTAVGEGSTVITAACHGATKEIPVEVFWVRTEAISFNADSLGLSSAGKMKIDTIASPAIEFTPTNATLQDVEFRSSNPDVVLVEDGQLIAVGTGSTTITATSPEAETSVEVTVYDNSALIGIGAVALVGGSVLFFVRHKKNRSIL